MFQQKTFRPKKKVEKDSNMYKLHKAAKATLHAGNLKKAVECPPGENRSEWIFTNTIDFFNRNLSTPPQFLLENL